MVKYAIHSLLWAERSDIEPQLIAEKAKSAGYDGIEIYVSPQQLESFDRRRVKEALDNTGMQCTGSTTLDSETDLTSTDEDTRRRGIEFLREAAKVVSDLGGHVLTGVTYVAWGKVVGRGRTEEEWVNSVESLKDACRLIRDYNVVLGLEPINRFETYFLNTAADAIRMAREIGEQNIGVHLDTFHMNIEEKNYYDPIVNTGRLLCHMHCCESDRGVPGTGNVNWDEVFKGLAEIGYDGWITLESFTREIKSVAASTAIWRDLAPSPEALASEGLRFLKSMRRKYERK